MTQLSQEDLVRRFVGGQIGVINLIRGFIFQGEISAIELYFGLLKVTTTWKARQLSATQWVAAKAPNEAPYEAILVKLYEVGEEDGCIVIRPKPEYSGRATFTLYPPGDEGLIDPSIVEGLDLSSTAEQESGLIPVSAFGLSCTYDIGHHETRTSTTCDDPATSLAQEHPDAHDSWPVPRCRQHEGRIARDGRHGEVITTVRRNGDLALHLSRIAQPSTA